jgi:hypothetical protein
MTIRHYRSEDGIDGYAEGDLLINDTTGERSRVVRDGRGLCLEPDTDTLAQPRDRDVADKELQQVEHEHEHDDDADDDPDRR